MAKTNKKDNEQKPVMGRPSLYSEDLANRICELISTNTCSLQRMCKENDWMPSFGTIFKWLHDKDKQDFFNKYAHAKRLQGELMVEELNDIADNTDEDYFLDDKGRVKTNHENINRSRLRVDTRKWIASKILPKKFGDKLDITTDGQKLTSQEFDLSKLSDGALAELAAARIVADKSGTV